jgi:hypothetical protein
MECAKALASRMQVLGGSDSHRLGWVWQQVTGTPADAAVVERLGTLHRNARIQYQQEPGLLKEVGGEPEWAAAVVVASTLLNLDETLTK